MGKDDNSTVKSRASRATGSSCLVLLGFAFLLGFAPLSSSFSIVANADGPDPSIALDPDEGEVGSIVAIQGSGFTPTSQIELEFGGDEISTVEADGDGEFSFEFEVPEFTAAGPVTIAATEVSADENSASKDFLVINTPPVTDSHPPVTVEENGSELITLTAGDANGDALTLEIVDEPSHGFLPEIDGDAGEVVYVPDPEYVGSDSFSFKVNDGASDSNVSVVSLTVTAEEASDDADIAVSTEEDEEVTITLEAIGLDSAPISFEIISNPDHGTLDEIVSTGPYTAQVEFTPEPDYSGQDEFIFMALDSASGSETGTVSITITEVNDAPVALSKSVSVNENSKKKILLEAFDAEDDSLSYGIVSQPGHGTLTGSPPDIFYDPEDGYTGLDDFRFRVSDSKLQGNVATITISIDSNEGYTDDNDEEEYRPDANSAPVSQSQSISGTEDTAVSITLSAEDSDGDSLTFSIIEYPSFGEITDFDDSSGKLTYTPHEEYSGSDSFSFIASDGHKKTKKATVSISIEPVNDPPRPVSMNVTALEGTANITLMASDPEGDLLEFALFDEPANGTLTGTVPEVTYAADAGFVGYDKFLFTVTDNNRPDSRIGVVSILVGEPAAAAEENDVDTPDQPESTEADQDEGAFVPYEPVKEPDDEKKDGKDEKKSTTKARADKSKVLVELNWEHHTKERGIESTLHLKFSDHKTRESLGSHVWYDLVMLDEQSNEILSKYDLVALDSQDTQMITFPANGTYHFEVNVKGLVDKTTNSIARNTDYTGKALGIVVVPEFGSSWVVTAALGSVMGAALLLVRYRANFIQRQW